MYKPLTSRCIEKQRLSFANYYSTNCQITKTIVTCFGLYEKSYIWQVFDCFYFSLRQKKNFINWFKEQLSLMELYLLSCKYNRTLKNHNFIRHILRYRAHFSLAGQKNVFLKIAWKQPIKAFFQLNMYLFCIPIDFIGIFNGFGHISGQISLTWPAVSQ